MAVAGRLEQWPLLHRWASLCRPMMALQLSGRSSWHEDPSWPLRCLLDIRLRLGEQQVAALNWPPDGREKAARWVNHTAGWVLAETLARSLAHIQFALISLLSPSILGQPAEI